MSSTLIGDYAFQLCSSLTQVVFTGGLTLLGTNMFDMDGGTPLLTSITIPSSVSKIGSDSHLIVLIDVYIVFINKVK